LIFHRGPLTGGTELTRQFALRHGKPLLSFDLNDKPKPANILQWIKLHSIQSLNIAGPRESTCPGIYEQARGLLVTLLSSRDR
ncbi:MAG TPA: putative molybdenum carrier protein, partial [Pirellulaceae bacterium]|nr:putative molybdenum carrier protein [Pirellulaceae bacterium]